MRIKIKNKNTILLILLVASIIFMGIGYSAINSVTGEINVTVSAEAQEGVFITNVELVSEVDADTGISNINNYTGTTMNSTVALSTTNPNSEIVYKVTVYNRGEQNSTYLGALYDEEFYDNLGIVFEVEGISVEDEIAPKETKEFTIKFKYKDGVIPESNILNSYINFKFGNPNRLMLANQNDGTYLNSGIAREQIENIRFVYGEVPNEGVISFFDASEKGNESIWGYYTDTDGNGMYELTFTSTEPIYTNIDSSFLFYNLNNVKTINFENFSTTGTTKMKAFFYGCNNLTNLNLNKINTSQVTDMSYLFGSCISLTSLDVSKFDTSQATNMKYMFYMCKALTSLDVTKFNTSQVTNMECMFYGCNLLTSLDVSKFDTSQVINMKTMFYACESLTSLDVSKFNTSQVTNMSGLFYACGLLKNIDLSSFDTSKVTDMNFMFSYCVSLTSLDVSKFNTSNVTNMMLMFEGCISLTSIDLSNFDTSNVTAMAAMFEMCFSLTNIDVSNFDTSNVTDMSYMFNQCTGLTNIDISSFNTSNVTNMSRMFNTNPNLKTIYASKYNEETDTGWTTKNVTNSSSMFTGCTSLVGGNGTVFDSAHIDKEYARIDKEGQPGYLTNKNPVENRLMVAYTDTETYLNSGVARDKIEDIKFVYGEVPSSGVISQFDASEKQDGSIIGYYTDTDGNNMYELTFTSTDTIYANVYSGYLFYDLLNVKAINFENFSTKGTTSMQAMFCLSIENYNNRKGMALENIIGLEKFDTSQVTDMGWLFMGCANLKSLNLSGFNTSQVTNMKSMFDACASIETLDLSNFDTNNVTDMSFLFYCCRNLVNLNISSFNTSSVTTMESMFDNCSSITNIDLSNFDTSKVVEMSYMFNWCEKLEKLDIKNFNTSKVTDMSYMFANCISLTSLDVSNFNTSNVTNMTLMFGGNPYESTIMSLSEIKGLEKFDTKKVQSFSGMFAMCAYLKTIDTSDFDTSSMNDCEFMFMSCQSLTELNLKKFKTDNAQYIDAMFYGCTSLTELDLSSFNTSKANYTNNMFYNCTNLKTIYVSEYNEETGTGWTTKNVTNSTAMFTGCTSLVGGNGTKFDSSHTDKEYGRIDKYGEPGYLTNKTKNRLKISNQNDTTYLGTECPKNLIEKIEFIYGEVPNSGVVLQFDASEEQNGSIMGYYTDADNNGLYELTFCSKEAIYTNINSSFLFSNLTNLKELKLDNFYTKGTTNMSCMFHNCTSLVELNLGDNFITDNVTDMTCMFGAENNTSGIKLNKIVGLEKFNTSNVTIMDAMFWNNRNITELNLTNFNTSNVTSMVGMFSGCYELVDLNISSFDTSNVTDMRTMFDWCESLVNLDLSNFNTSRVTNMDGMFDTCTNLKTINLSSFDTSNVTNMSNMFKDCKSITTLNLNNIKTNSVTDMTSMFYNCTHLTSLDLSSFDTNNVTSMNSMFLCCTQLKEIKFGSNFNTKNVTDMFMMFQRCGINILDLSTFNTSKVNDMRYMFYNCSTLTTIYVSEYNETTDTGWTTKSVTNSTNMFNFSRDLVGGIGTTYNSSILDATYARIDKAGEPGYFTNITDKQ